MFREPIPAEALPELISAEAIDGLIERGLVRRANQDELDVHDLVREFSTRSMDDQIQKDLHRRASEWYARSSMTTESNRTSPSPQSSRRLGRFLHCPHDSRPRASKWGHTELLGILRSIEHDGLDPSVECMVHELSGEILLIQGVWNEAEKQFDSAGSIARRIKASKGNVEDSLQPLHLGVKRGALDDALEMLRQALGIQINMNDAKGAADSYISMGDILSETR